MEFNAKNISLYSLFFVVMILSFALYISAMTEINKTPEKYKSVKDSVLKYVIICIVFIVIIAILGLTEIYLYYKQIDFSVILTLNFVVGILYISLIILSLVAISNIPTELKVSGPLSNANITLITNIVILSVFAGFLLFIYLSISNS